MRLKSGFELRFMPCKITYWRLRCGYSVKNLSYETGIPTQTLYRYENGENMPSAQNLGVIAWVLQVPISAFYVLSCDSFWVGENGSVE